MATAAAAQSSFFTEYLGNVQVLNDLLQWYWRRKSWQKDRKISLGDQFSAFFTWDWFLFWGVVVDRVLAGVADHEAHLLNWDAAALGFWTPRDSGEH